MKTIDGFQEILKLAESGNLYIRWSRGPEMDKAQGHSRDYVSGHSHNGLSCQQVHADRPSLAAMMLVEYQFLRRKDAEIYGWIFTATANGTDSDNAPTVDGCTIEPVGRLSDELVAKLSAYSTAYWAHRHYVPKTWAEGQTHIASAPQLADYL